MSFSIELKQNNSPLNFVNKELIDKVTVTGVLRDGANVVDPVLLIESHLTEDIVGSINYLYIPVFKRYYFVTNITAEVDGLWTLEGHCDVLMTYREQIKRQEAIVSRQENIRNMYLDDGSFMAYQNPYIFTRYFSNPSPFASEEYVLIVAGS